jgi:hypothetical protein
MTVSEQRLVSFGKSVITFASRPLLVLPAAVDQQRGGDDQRQTQHTNVDGMTGDVARTIQYISSRVRKRGLVYLRILRKISERSNERSTVCNHDLSASSGCTNVVGSEVIGQPSHHERTAWEDTSSDQESTTILDRVVVAGDEHDISSNGDGASDQHEGTSHAILVGKICNE